MANHLVRITDKDYRDFRRNYSKITYSFNKHGEPAQISEDEVREFSNNFLNSIIGKGDFLDIMDEPEKYELYFLKNDVEEIIGVLSLTFSEKSCFISESIKARMCDILGINSQLILGGKQCNSSFTSTI